jgi:hypothetical protein
MKEVFIKKYWDEEGVLFYLHFQGETAVRQIEITSKDKKLLSLSNPVKSGSMLYDQKLNELELKSEDFITKEEFEKAWQDK